MATATKNREILEQSEISTVECGDGPSALRQAILAGQELVQKTKASFGGNLTCVGIASMGITHENGIALSPNVPGWADLRIGSAMSEAFRGIPIRIDNDVKVAALAEVRRGALKGKAYGLYVNFGTGLSIAYTLGDQVLSGHNGASGEIGYFLRHDKDRFGIRDGVAPLEEFCGGKAIGLRASKFFGESMTTKDLFIRAASDERAHLFIEETFQEVSFHLTNLIMAWDPETVVFGGGIVAGSDLILPYITQKVEQFVPFPPELTVAHFDRYASLIGAIELAL